CDELVQSKYNHCIIFEVLPFSTALKLRESRYYFIDQITLLEKELATKIDDEKATEAWLEERSIKVNAIMRERNFRIQEDYYATLRIKTDRRSAINAKLDQMCKEKNEDGSFRFHRMILNRCSSLDNYFNLPRPFNEMGWKRLRRNLELEYDHDMHAEWKSK
ncbi:9146_t:CDS:1, partial [Scutellospora calospora]